MINKQPLMIRPRLPDGGFGEPQKAFPNEKTPQEISQIEVESIRQQLAESDKMLLDFIEYTMSGGGN